MGSGATKHLKHCHDIHAHEGLVVVGSEAEFTINGKPYKASSDLPLDTSLNTFIREHAHLKGTKFMCLEGGCGACIVAAHYIHPTTKEKVTQAVNSCLIPVLACHGWAIETVEGIGNKFHGYDKVQKRLAAANGTQCGYCTPGMIMNMYSLLKENPKITMKEVENSFGGNICRCTGYRPILDAFKSLASDAPPELTQKLADIEDMVCPTTGKKCGGKCEQKTCGGKDDSFPVLPEALISFEAEGSRWYRPVTIKEVFEIFDMIGDKSYRFVAGNTGQGVYRITHPPDAWIDVNGIPDLHGSEVKEDGLVLGGNIGLTEAMNLFYKLAKEKPEKFEYCKTLADHIDLIANVPVRNTGTFAGNIAMKHENEEFPSDLFLFLETVGAKLIISDYSAEATMGLLEYLKASMKKKIIKKVLLPVLDNKHYITRSYKIMPRAQNAHAYVNAGFCVKVDKKDKYKVLGKPTLLFGGIKPNFLHATKTEEYLNGKDLLDDATLQGALKVLESELDPDHIIPDATPAFRKGLAESLFYKFILSVAPDSVNPAYKSGGALLERPVSSAKQDFDTDRNIWPLNKPIPKIEALIQCSGEAEYTNDMPAFPDQLWAQLVLCNRAKAVCTPDASEALKMPGVVAFFAAKDIPGKNNFAPPGLSFTEPEAVFVDGKSDYAGQAVGVIVAESHALAMKAALKVKVKYENPEPVHCDAREVIDKGMSERIKEYAKIEPKEKKTDIKHKITGRWDIKSQYHYTMETQSVIAVPTETELDIYPSTQWPAGVQESVSYVLGIPQNEINIRVRRLGGGYGCKITRTHQIACAAALAATKLRRPVRMVLKMETNMEWTGKRFPIMADYEVGVSDSGEIQYLTMKVYEDEGHVPNDVTIGGTIHHLPSAYDTSAWDVKGYTVITDNASNTWCRAPGSAESICLIENIMEHIANVVKKDPVDVRLANIKKDAVPKMVADLKKSSDYDARVKEVEDFNKANRWKKRGITLVVMEYPFYYFGGYSGMVSIYSPDGTVAISHGGIEMGQGLNTKAAQVAAHILGIDLSLISIKPTYNFASPNNTATGGSVGSEAVSYAVKMCCEELNKRLEPSKQKLGEKAKWADVIKDAFYSNVNLCSTYMFSPKDDVKNYDIYGVCVTEVEVDLLTGQHHIKRVDLIEDAGQSLSPEVDIGQVEGAFVMGLGYFTCEELVYQKDTGALLTNRTWNYKPPGAKDIPIDFRVTLRKNSTNPVGVLRSKATGEPPFCLSSSVLFALRNALESARKDAGIKDEDWFALEQPYTGERVWLGTSNKKEMFKIK